jgi:Zn-dependent M28 family amino/carboxypeptidase
MVANINMDELAALFPLKDVIGMGAEHSSLGADFDAAAKEVGLVPAPDPYPEETIFVRSDQFPFVRAGVPAIYTVPGLTSSDPKIDGKAVYSNWLENIYHTPKDQMDLLKFDWPSNVKLVKLNFVIGNRVANAADRPRWNKGDIFQEKFGGPVQK